MVIIYYKNVTGEALDNAVDSLSQEVGGENKKKASVNGS
jgi:hypothetical protein